ncbi:multidrug efflux SMR transporter [Roseibium sp. CAU 1637]|uniref:Multidrug efflux SMR transporter n=1 Tax=Roseibium limicola TaxID=2816037 RepID=A0A939EMV0_9HYPH|nr:multidrug efflux SMR transporter [Roseibium limicola]MBO0344777.1 multidrug efflux SMR transporter [Roseibium limicola]
MSPLFYSYGALAIAIALEVAGTSFLQASQQFTKSGPVLAMTLCYGVSFYLLSISLKVLPVGIAYAVWSGLGIVLISLVGVLLFRQSLDLAALIGLGLIILGVVVVNVFSSSTGH